MHYKNRIGALGIESFAKTPMRDQGAELGPILPFTPAVSRSKPMGVAPLPCDVGVQQVFSKGAAPLEDDDHGLSATTSVDHKLDSRDFL